MCKLGIYIRRAEGWVREAREVRCYKALRLPGSLHGHMHVGSDPRDSRPAEGGGAVKNDGY